MLKSLAKNHFFVDSSSATSLQEKPPTSSSSATTTINESTDTTNNSDRTSSSSVTVDESLLQSVTVLFEPIRQAASKQCDGVTMVALVDAFAAFAAPNLCVSPSAWHESTREHAALLRLALQYVDPALSNFLRDSGIALEIFAQSWVSFNFRCLFFVLFVLSCDLSNTVQFVW